MIHLQVIEPNGTIVADHKLCPDFDLTIKITSSEVVVTNTGSVGMSIDLSEGDKIIVKV